MNWHNMLKNISILGAISSVIIATVGFILLVWVLKGDKYADKLVEETPLLKYSIVMYTGVVLSIVFQFILLVQRLFE
jgi:hypothetical protein